MRGYASAVLHLQQAVDERAGLGIEGVEKPTSNDHTGASLGKWQQVSELSCLRNSDDRTVATPREAS
jgi:hypothetical protein